MGNFCAYDIRSFTNKKKYFSAAQVGVRKDVDPAFGLFFSARDTLTNLCLFCDKAILNKMMLSCRVLHKMIIKTRRDGYERELFQQAYIAVDGRFLI